MMDKHNHFKSRVHLNSLVTAAVCLTVTLTILTLVLVVDHFARGYAVEQAESRLQQLSVQMRDSVDRALHNLVKGTEAVASLPTLREQRGPAEIRTVLNSLQKASLDYVWFGVTNRTGVLMAASQNVLEGTDVSQRPWYINAKEHPFATDYHPAASTFVNAHALPDTADGLYFVDYSVPIQDMANRYAGVLSVHMSWDWIMNMSQALTRPLPENSQIDVLMLDAEQNVIAGPKDILHKPLAGFLPANGAAIARQPTISRLTSVDGKRYLTSFIRLGGDGSPPLFNWTIVVRQPIDVAMAGFSELQRRVLLAGCLIGLSLAILASISARRLSKPLNFLSRSIEQRIANGGNGDISQSSDYYEIHVLSTTLAQMVEREREQSDTLQALNQNLEATVEDRTRDLATRSDALSEALYEQSAIRRALETREIQLRSIFENTTDAFLAIDPEGVVREWNRAAETLFNWSKDDALGRSVGDLIAAEDPASGHQALSELLNSAHSSTAKARVETRAKRNNGEWVPVELSVVMVETDSGSWRNAFLHDISERQMLKAALTGMALSDPLTDLPNRRAFLHRLPDSMARADRAGKMMAVLFMDLDGFKEINDSLGHEGGDDMLRITAKRLIAGLRTTDVVARFAGDEFVMILENLQQATDADIVARHLLHAIEQPYLIKDTTVMRTGSIGVALYVPGSGLSGNDLIVRSDLAMYRAKELGKNQFVILQAHDPLPADQGHVENRIFAG